MRYKIGVQPFGRVFTVPCSAVDNYIKPADSKFCKALLAMLCTDTDIADTEEIAERCGISPADAEDALLYWSGCGVMTVSAADGGEPVSAEISAKAASAPDRETARVCMTEAIDPMKNTAAARSTVRYTPKELAQKAKENDELAALFEEVQKIFGRPINGTETAGLVNLYEYYGYSAPTILLIAQYAHDLGKDRIAYIEAVAKDWYSRGLTEYSQVEEEMIRRTEIHSLDGKIKRVLGIEGTLTDKQQDLFAQWREWGFTEEVIDLAGQRCKEEKNKINIRYINGILKRWHKDKLFTADAVLSSERAYAESHTQAQLPPADSSYDVESWEDMALTFDPTKLGFEEE